MPRRSPQRPAGILTDGNGYEDGTWYGRIERDGSITTGRAFNENIRAILRRLADEPAKVASEYGTLTGSCCFCCLPLKDERSTAVGYGPVCAKHFNLPWG